MDFRRDARATCAAAAGARGAFAAAILMAGAGGGSAAAAVPDSVPLQSSGDSGDPAAPRFVALPPDRTGIDFVNHGSPQRRNERGEIVFFGTDSGRDTAGGACIGDLDGDGLPEVFLTRSQGGNRLFRNLGGMRFEDVTSAAGLDDPGMWTTGATMVDLDGDGDLDLVACAFGQPNRVYRNEGALRFSECAGRCGLDFSGASMMMSFADVDGDGDLDGYLLTNFLEVPGWRDPVKLQFDVRTRLATNIPPGKAEQIGAVLKPGNVPFSFPSGQFDRLYRNDGPSDDGFVRFTEVGEEAGIRRPEMGLSATWWDYNGDGRPDLYVANDFYGSDRLYRNDTVAGGPIRFTDVAPQALPHTPWYSMGSDSGDIDNDGLPDLIATDMAGTTHYKEKMGMGEMEDSGWFLEFPEPRQYMRNALYRNTGTPRFMEIAFLAGVASSDWTWAAKLADLDGDGWLDLFFTNGMTRDLFNSDLKEQEAAVIASGNREAAATFWRDKPRKNDRNLAFRNDGNLHFDEVGEAWGLGHAGVSFAAAVGDLDRDGDLDLVVNNYEEPASIYRNDRAPGRSAVGVRLVGRAPNTFAVGATVAVTAGGITQSRFASVERGYLSCNDPVLHFGLGALSGPIDRLVVRWPSGREDAFTDLAPDRLYTIREPGDAGTEASPQATQHPALFVPSPALAGLRHRENVFDDFARQPLLPNRLSTLGPGIAWGDVDGDGDHDLYFGGAHGMAGQVWIANAGAGGTFALSPQPALDADKFAEDMGVVFFDAEGDGDLDLYVVSGGSDFAEDDIFLRDRLYLNDGSGAFAAAPKGMIPDVRDSGSCVAAADFDRDGDIDLFVGGRQVPGRYPLMPSSRLLVNEAGRFVDRAPPPLANAGLVTSALWSDADGDGRLDLLVTREWGAIGLFRNTGGRLEDATEASGLADLTGWWNGIAAADIDRDGDLDYAVANFGLNTKYKTAPGQPAVLYYGDFDGSGEMHLVEAKRSGDRWIPRRGFSCSRNAMPFLREKLGTFDRFANSSLAELYGDDRLDTALRLEAAVLESGILRNDGTGRFSFEPLPRLAQASPAFGVAFTDADADGFPDLVIAQNFHGPQPETGRMDGGVSLALRNINGEAFEPMTPDTSGIMVAGDAKALTIADLDGDPVPDLAFTRNDGPAAAFVGRLPDGHHALRIHLAPTGSPSAPRARLARSPGARIRLVLEDGSFQDAEIAAGSGYLGQSVPAATFGLGRRRPVRAEVGWPEGTRSEHPVPDDWETNGTWRITPP